MPQKYIISLEIGSSAVKLGAASTPSESEATPLRLLGVESQPLHDCVRFGRIQNVEDVKVRTMMALDQLQNNPALAGAEVTGVYAAIGGRGLRTHTVSAELRLPDERLISDDLIDRLRDDALAQLPADIEILEAIPVRYSVDGVETSRPVGAYGTVLRGEFTAVVCPMLNARNIERVAVERLNLDICGYIVRPLALADATLTIDDTKPGCMLVDFGAETTTVAIYKNCALRYINTIPMGSRNITRDLAEILAITEDRAEQIKLRVGNAMPESGSGIDSEQLEIDNIVQARAAEIVANVLAHIEFAGFSMADLPGGLVVTGRGAKLKNLCALLKAQSQLPVRTALVPADVRIDDPAVEPSDNLDVVAVSLQAARRATSGGAHPDCVIITEPVAKQPEVGTHHGASAASAGDNPSDEQTLEEDSYNVSYTPAETSLSYSETEYEDAPSRSRVNDEDLLEDDDRAAERQQRRQAEARKRAEKEARKRAKEEARRQRETERAAAAERAANEPSLIDRLKNMIAKINDGSDGADLEDDE